MKKKIIAATTVMAIAGIAIYLATRERNKKQERKRKEDRDDYLANTFSHAKRYKGGEFVL